MELRERKTALRMIPYGLYVLTAESPAGVAAATVNWVTQASFEPPLLAVGVKADSEAHARIKEAGTFALNVLGRDQGDLAIAFFKHREREGDSIGGQRFRSGKCGAPLLAAAAAVLGCRLVDTLERGDHSLFLGELVEVEVQREIPGRPDAATLVLADLGDGVFYGG